MDARDLHAATCDIGGGVVQGHNAIRDWLAEWLERMTGRKTGTEAFVPAWDKPLFDAQGQPVWEVDAQGQPVLDAQGRRVQKVQKARLDVTYIDGDGRRCYVDVAVTSAATTAAAALAARAGTDGAAAADTARSKRTKYPPAKSPHTPLVPFVVEALGRLSPEAHGLLGAAAPEDKQVRSQVLRTAKQTLSVLVQTGLAEQLLSAAAGRGCEAPVGPVA